MTNNNPAAARNAEVNARLSAALAKLPSLPGVSRSPRPLVRCACGCFGLTQRRFVPGHDAKLAAWVKRVERGIVDIAWIAANASTDAAEAQSIAAAVAFAMENGTAPKQGIGGTVTDVMRTFEDVAMEAMQELMEA